MSKHVQRFHYIYYFPRYTGTVLIVVPWRTLQHLHTRSHRRSMKRNLVFLSPGLVEVWLLRWCPRAGQHARSQKDQDLFWIVFGWYIPQRVSPSHGTFVFIVGQFYLINIWHDNYILLYDDMQPDSSFLGLEALTEGVSFVLLRWELAIKAAAWVRVDTTIESKK